MSAFKDISGRGKCQVCGKETDIAVFSSAMGACSFAYCEDCAVHGINWNDFPVDCKRGSCCYRQAEETSMPDPKNSGKMITVSRRKWIVDKEPLIFTQDRNYVERWL